MRVEIVAQRENNNPSRIVERALLKYLEGKDDDACSQEPLAGTSSPPPRP